VRRDGITICIFGDLVEVVARIARVGDPFADDGVAHPVDKLLVLGIGDLGLIHPEIVDRDTPCGDGDAPERIEFAGTHGDGAAGDQHHVVGGGFIPHLAHRYARQLPSHAADPRPAAGGDQQQCK